MKRKIVAGNWKMHTTPSQGEKLLRELSHRIGEIPPGVETLVLPPFTHLGLAAQLLPRELLLGAQDLSPEPMGAHTGDISAEMLTDIGCRYVLVGHSERREHHGERDELLLRKIHRARENNLGVIFCCGEPESSRQQGLDAAWDYVGKELNLLKALAPNELEDLMIAYEPIWAIGTGVTASAEDAEAMASRIKAWAKETFGTLAHQIPILYGGSCNPSNARGIFSQPHVDGGLIGGASLKADDFIRLTQSF